jgi:predicted alpha/beta-hydrolase family hydrolase
MAPDLIFTGPAHAAHTLALAHGAGAGMDTPFMRYFAEGLAEHGLRVARFEFPYMAGRRRDKKGPPDREPVLRATWLQVVQEIGTHGLIVGGKSMGGRIASLIVDEVRAAGLVCLGYPFHPVGKPDRLRVAHLRTIQTPTLILQGTRDPFGGASDVAGYDLSPSVQMHWLEDGDHSFKPRKASGRTEEGNWLAALEAIVAFAKTLPS